jgi:hypothetical protein
MIQAKSSSLAERTDYLSIFKGCVG